MARQRKKTAEPVDLESLSVHPQLCPDGVYRWIYRLPMLKNPVILLTTMKAFVVAALIMWALLSILLLFSDGFTAEAFISAAWAAGIGLAVISALLVIAFPLVAWIYGGTYNVLFEMDENGITHTQLAEQFKRARIIGMLTFFAGLFSKRPTTMGAGLLSASRQSMRTPFSGVNGVSTNRTLRVIYLREVLSHNHVYVDPEDYDFVLNYIRERVDARKGGAAKG